MYFFILYRWINCAIYGFMTIYKRVITVIAYVHAPAEMVSRYICVTSYAHTRSAHVREPRIYSSLNFIFLYNLLFNLIEWLYRPLVQAVQPYFSKKEKKSIYIDISMHETRIETARDTVFFLKVQNKKDKKIFKNHQLRVKVETSSFKMLF